MHIGSGEYKGFGLDYPKTQVFRPTQSRVREALFNILKPVLKGARFLDLCAGTGAIGLEAFSQGASTVVMVDAKPSFLKKNVLKFCDRYPGADPEALTVVGRDARLFLKGYQGDPFDVIFLDPPWELEGLYEDLLNLITGFGILSGEGRLVCEHPKRRTLSLSTVLDVTATYVYGDTALSIIVFSE